MPASVFPRSRSASKHALMPNVNTDLPYQPPAIKGRGALQNPESRFDKLHSQWEPGEEMAPNTEWFIDNARSIITRNDSPDVGFEYSINPYRGCEHGCVYCYARPTHEYLGLSAGLDFESRLFVKTSAESLLRQELAETKWQPKTIALSGVTDCYQPLERKLKITQACLQVLAEFGNPVAIITKSHLIERDLEILKQLAAVEAVSVTLSITTLDPILAAKLEPRASRPARRLQAVQALAQAGIPVGVNVAPLIPGLTDHEIPAILKAAKSHGAQFGDYGMVRLPYGVAELFESWLEEHFPNKKSKILNRIREIRGGQLNDPRFKTRMRGVGPYAKQIDDLFKLSARRADLSLEWPKLSVESFKNPGLSDQLTLF